MSGETGPAPTEDEQGPEGSEASGGETRVQASILAGPERAVLDWMIPRLPRWVSPDLLTGGALLAMIVAGFAYSRAAEQPWLLHVVNVCLFIHWFGDSMDGGLARYRNQSRPKYGFYVDHMSDSLGAFAVSVGAAFSGVMSPWLAALILVLYLLLAVHSYLALFSEGLFHLSMGGVGPTELRLVVGVINLLVLWTPTIELGGRTWLTFDLFGGGAAVVLALLLLVQIGKTTARLYDLERI
ncbi:MAG: CDP-alcohol phosphatidyltransferase family protein [Longimicrobiales bacterium]